MCPPIICSKITTIVKLTSIISLNLLSNLHYQTIVAIIIITLTTFLISSIIPQTAEI